MLLPDIRHDISDSYNYHDNMNAHRGNLQISFVRGWQPRTSKKFKI